MVQFASFLDHSGLIGLRKAFSVALRRPSMVAIHRPYRHLRSAYCMDAFDAHGWFQWRHWLRTQWNPYFRAPSLRNVVGKEEEAAMARTNREGGRQKFGVMLLIHATCESNGVRTSAYVSETKALGRSPIEDIGESCLLVGSILR